MTLDDAIFAYKDRHGQNSVEIVLDSSGCGDMVAAAYVDDSGKPAVKVMPVDDFISLAKAEKGDT